MCRRMSSTAQFKPDRAAASCGPEDLISNEVQSHIGRLRLIEEIGVDRLSDIGAQFIPGVGLREDVVREAFSHKTAILFLANAKNDFWIAHALKSATIAPC